MEADQSPVEYNRPAQALPYLSVLPMTEQYLDLFILERVQAGLAEQLIEQLLRSETSIVMHIPLGIQNNTPAEQISQLKALQRSFKGFHHQAQGLSIGFPLLLLEDQELGRPVSAPLFIWKIALKEVAGSNMDWTIVPLNGNRGYLNPLMKNYLEARFDFRWEEAIGLIDMVDKTVLQQTLERLAELGPLEIAPPSTITPSPLLDQATLNSSSHSLILGQFEPITVQENKKLPKNLQTKHRREWLNRLPALLTNHQQRAWLETIFNGHHIVVEGSFKTGKTHAIAAALPSVLADQGSVLIVSPQPSTFNDLYHHLEGMNLLNVGILSLQDEVMDKERLIAYLERLPKHTRSIPAFDEVIYSQELDAYRTLEQQLVTIHQRLHAPLFKGWNWLQLLGHGLLEHQQRHRQLLGRFLDPSNFKFTEEEFDFLVADLSKHYPLFRPLDALKHSLNALDGRFFADRSSLEKAQEEVRHLVHLYRHRTQRLYDRYLIFVGEYAELLHLRYREFVTRMEQQIDKIEGQIDLYKRLYGEAFDKQSSFQDAKLKVLSVFSRKYQAIRAAKAQLLRDYQQLKEEYTQSNYLEQPFPNIKEEVHLADVAIKLEELRQALKNWQLGVPTLVNTTTKSLAIDSDFPDNFQTQLEDLETDYKELLEEINADKLLLRPVKSQATLLADKESFLLTLLLQLQKLEHHWEDFAPYYRWRRSWLGLHQHSQKVVQALVKAGAKDWLTYFKSWYFHQILLQYYSSDLPTQANNEALPFHELQERLAPLQKQLYRKVPFVTKARQRDQIKRIKREKDLALTKARSIFKNKKIKDVLEWIGLDQVGQVFPIVLATPEMASQLVGTQVAAFDWVILENAHDLPQQLGVQLLQLGNQQIVFGQPLEGENPRLEDNVLAWMLEQKGRQQQQFTKVHSKDAAPLARLDSPAKGTQQAFHELLSNSLSPYIDVQRLQFQVSVEGVVVDLLVAAKPDIHSKGLAVIIDSGLLHQEVYDFQLAVQRQQILQQQNHPVYYLWSVDWWKDDKKALEQLLAQILAFDQQVVSVEETFNKEEEE
ncbi:MAG: hypothetical protein ACRBFS_24680 [Aureispira sp.]